MSIEDKICKQHFVETHQRAANGRYVVRLSFKEGLPLDIRSSRENAALLYSKLECPLKGNLDLAKQRNNFLSKTQDYMKSWII